MAQRELISVPTLTGHGIGNIKAHNLRAVLLTLLHQGPTSRASAWPSSPASLLPPSPT